MRVQLVPRVVRSLATLAIRIGADLFDGVRVVPIDAEPERGVLIRCRAGYQRNRPRPLDIAHGPATCCHCVSAPVRAGHGAVATLTNDDGQVPTCSRDQPRRACPRGCGATERAERANT